MVEEKKEKTEGTEKEEKSEKFEFQSEVKQLLNILVYSLYQHKEVFLRELISNAVDALNKVQFEILTDTDVEDKGQELRIDISFVKSQNKLVIEDTGVGMTRQELIDNIGTIAHSGTMDFLKKLQDTKKNDQVDLIGKFGVGFYSSFMVAEEIHLLTKSAQKGSVGYLWKSTGDSSYTIEETVKKSRGTRIELLLKKDEVKEFTDKLAIKNIITKHSKFVPFPIYLENEKIETKEAIWTQPKSKLQEKDYFDFYKFIENSEEEPDAYLHLSSDAPVQFQAMLYVPKTSFEMLGFFKPEPGVDLYCRKVLIQKASKEILPEYMRFIKGVIDSEDLPLNISRETVQSHAIISKIRKHVLKKIFEQLAQIKQQDKEKYERIWKNYQRNLKEGIITDYEFKEKLAELLLFKSSKTQAAEQVDLKEYIERMEKDQKEIYYVTGGDLASIEKNPALEAFRSKNFEVLYLVDPMDEFVIDHLRAFQGKSFKIAEGADIKLDKNEEKPEDKDYLKDVGNFVGYMKVIYGERIRDVRVSRRLVESPCLLVQTEGGPSVQMEKIMKMSNREYQFSKRILEINPDSSLIRTLVQSHKQKPDSENLKTLTLQLLDNMLLREGILDEIDHIVPRIQDIMLLAAKNIS